MKKFILLFIIGVTAFSLFSCSDGEGEMNSNSSGIKVVSAETDLKAIGDAQAITVNKDITKAYSNDNWLSVTAEGKTVSFAAAANKSRESRNTTIVIKASDSDSTIVNVSQKGLVFSYSDGNIVSPNEGGNFAKKVVSNEGFEILSAPDWITPTIDGDSIRMNVAENNTDDIRKGYVTFGTDQFKETIEVIQGSFEDNFLDQDYVLMGYNQNNQVEMYRANIFDWKGIDYLSLPDQGWTFGIEFDDETLTLKIANAQAIGSYLNTYYVYSSFLGADDYPYVDTSIYGNFKFDVMEDEDGTIVYAPLSGKISSIDIIGISFLLYTSNEATTSPVGQVNYLTNVTLLKMDADDMAGAKAYIQAKQYIMR